VTTTQPQVATEGEPQSLLDVEAIRTAIETGLAWDNGNRDSEALVMLVVDLNKYLNALLPMAEAAHQEVPASRRDPVVTHGLGYVARRQQYEPPDASKYPATAQVWAKESAGHCKMLLDTVLDTGKQQHGIAP
jgi:hypothetical protein